MSRLRPFLAPLVIVLLALLPLALASYPISIAGRILAFSLVVISADLLTGYTGLPTLAQVGYFGVGAYTAGLVGIHWTDNAFVQLGAGIVVAALVAAVTGAVAVRTGGIVFLMVTLAIGELLHQLVDKFSFTGASNGLVGIPPITLAPGSGSLLLPGVTYWWALAVFLIGLGAAIVVVRSPLGRSMRAVRESPTRLVAVGQHTYAVKLLSFVIAGGIAGAAGTAWTAQTRFISPGDLTFSVSAIALLAVILGGAGTLWGPVIAAAAVFIVRDWLASSYLPGHADLLLGILFVVGVFLLPRGVAGLKPAPRRPSEPTGAIA